MKRGHIIGTVIAVALVIGGAACYYLRQNMLSDQVRNAAIAAVGEGISQTDTKEYIRIANISVKTKRDAELVKELNRMSSLLAETVENDQNFWAYGSVVDSELTKAENCLAEARQDKSKLGYCGALHEKAKADIELRKSFRETSEAAKSEGAKLFNHIRVELGLPPLK